MFSTSSRVELRPASRLLVACVGAVCLFAAACGSGSTASDSGDTADTEMAATESTASESSDTEATDTETTDTETNDTESSDADTNDAETPAAEADGAETDTAEGAESETGGASGGDDSYLEAENPLAAFLGFDLSNPDAMVEQQRAIDQKIQECMSAQGFEYQLTQTSSDAFNVFKDQADMSPEEFAAEHGYGAVDFTKQFAAEMQGASDADPNQALLDSMSDTERGAWQAALYGSPADEAGAEAQVMPEGCLGDSMSEVLGNLQAFAQLAPKLDDMEAAFAADPRVLEINGRWATCMSEAGYDFESPQAAEEAVTDKIDAAMATATDPAAAASAEDETQAEEDLLAALDEIRVEEVAIATADATCQGKDAETLTEIRREYELNFIEENKATLESAGS